MGAVFLVHGDRGVRHGVLLADSLASESEAGSRARTGELELDSWAGVGYRIGVVGW